MASMDYILCKECGRKLIYDGDSEVAQSSTYDVHSLTCNECVEKLKPNKDGFTLSESMSIASSSKGCSLFSTVMRERWDYREKLKECVKVFNKMPNMLLDDGETSDFVEEVKELLKGYE